MTDTRSSPDIVGVLRSVHSALNDALGDTDVSHIENDDELREEYPIQWAAQWLAHAIELLPASLQPAAPTGGDPITHRWRSRGAETWIYDPEPGWLEEHKYEIEWEPVYGRPQPAQCSAGSERPSTFVHIASVCNTGKGPCDWSGRIDFIEPTTGRITGGTSFCKKCGMTAINETLRAGA